MKPFRVIAGHKYVPLANLKTRQADLTALAQRLQLKGHVVLSPEGIDLRVSGEPDSVEELTSWLKSWPELADIELRSSAAERSPFSRMVVRVKNELIRLGIDGLNVLQHAAPCIQPTQLAAWIDGQKPFTLLDVRNQHEVERGSFKGALSLSLNHFHELPAAIAAVSATLKGHPIVVFCTDGLRSHKAAALVQSQGFEQVHELEGGILNYLDHCGELHFVGRCVDADPRLSHSSSRTLPCASCGMPLTAEDRNHMHFLEGRSCGYCYRMSEEQLREVLLQREQKVRELASPLPGSTPRDQFRPINVPAECDGQPLIDVLCRIVIHAPPLFWQDRCRQGLLLDEQNLACAPDRIVRAGERFRHRFPDVVEPDVNMDIRLLHEDECLIVINKPAPLPLHSGGRFHRNTLMHVLDQLYAPQKLRPSHRLDANTSGVLVIARSAFAAKKIQTQFARGEVDKRYLVRVHGHPVADEFSCNAPISAEASDMGSRYIDEDNGLPSQTNFKVVMRDSNGTALLEAKPLTGRTNQIRVHLWHLGIPVCGDPVYLRGGEMGDSQTLDVNSPPMCLHAWRLIFKHPVRRETVSFIASPPSWASLDGSWQLHIEDGTGLRKNW
ncbi:MAG: RluA family pseudouridine synthase [Povalibacter sp.]